MIRNAASPILSLALPAILLICVTCTKPKVHYLRTVQTVTADSRELFGCRINGWPFSPLATDSSLLGACTYRQKYEGTYGFSFELVSNRHESTCEFSSVTIVLDSIRLIPNAVYRLGTPGDKKNYASYFVASDCGLSGVRIYTADDLYAEVVITRLDRHKQVVNGTFDFRMRDQNGDVVRISDGVFERRYRN